MIKKLLTVVILIVILIIVAFGVFKYFTAPVQQTSSKVNFMINKGSSISLIASNLDKNNLVKSSLVFKLYVQLSGNTNKILPGEFELDKNLSLFQIVEKLKKGPSEIWVTIPEGLRKEEVALKFKDSLSKDQVFLEEFLNLTKLKEGYLFPDTYLFPKTATAKQIVDKMSSNFDKKVGDVAYKELIVASMLERETFSDDEKPIVAGILFKRLENDWPLQVDATLQYAKDSLKFKQLKSENKYWQPIYSEDKNIDSKYNTYKNLGLPPAPIASPGLTSIAAAKNPSDSEYWYYIHDLKGKIHFAKTLEEHNQNINTYLR